MKHFAPYILQYAHHACILTDSKACVQAYEKLCRGSFSASPRINPFLSTVSRYQASVRHIRGIHNLLSDFGSHHNPIECRDNKCQVCQFVQDAEHCVVRDLQLSDVVKGTCKLPFLSRTAWLDTQSNCEDLRRVHAHLRQGTRPSKKLTKIHDIKRYLNHVTFARDNLLLVKSKEPFSTRERIVIPRAAISGLITALHLKRIHPTAHQLKTVCHRYLFALDFDREIDTVVDSCHQCTLLTKSPSVKIPQSTSTPPEVIGIQFLADVIQRETQRILVVREHVTSFTSTSILPNDQHQCLRDGLISACIEFRPIDGPSAIIRVDPAPGFRALINDILLKGNTMIIEVGNPKNLNKNPIAEKAIQGLE